MALNTTHERILLIVHRLHALTNTQLQRYLGLRTKRYVEETTQALANGGYLFKRVAIKDGRGSLPNLYMLDAKGREHLRSLGVLPAQRFRKSEQEPYPSPYHLRHLVALNDVLITYELLQQRCQDVELLACLHDFDMKRWNERLTPDAWVHVQQGAGDHAWIIEVDRGTESSSVVRQKVGALCDLVDNDARYRKLFGVSRMTGIIFVSAGNPFAIPPVAPEKRLETLAEWVESELVAKQLPIEWRQVFHFTTLDDATNEEWLSTHL